MRAVVYLRVSTEGQVDAWGFDVQTHACQTYAEARGIEVVEWIRDEAITGKSDAADRPGLLA
jgi:DNA invertase Pin-like site-specific DNA recombinase